MIALSALGIFSVFFLYPLPGLYKPTHFYLNEVNMHGIYIYISLIQISWGANYCVFVCLFV